jgi:hypothetical protein
MMETSSKQLAKKLCRACTGSGLGDDAIIAALTETLVGRINLGSSTGDPQQLNLRRRAKFAAYTILDGVSSDTEAAKALCAELCAMMGHIPTWMEAAS